MEENKHDIVKEPTDDSDMATAAAAPDAEAASQESAQAGESSFMDGETRVITTRGGESVVVPVDRHKVRGDIMAAIENNFDFSKVSIASVGNLDKRIEL